MPISRSAFCQTMLERGNPFYYNHNEFDFDENELRKVDVQVTRLRQKIEENPKQPHFIKTIRGKGYKLICNEI